jgi:hypothetical protein
VAGDLYAYLVGAIALGFVASAAFAGRALRRALASRKWPATTGTVVSIDMLVEQTVREPLYVPKIRYRYCVNGVQYEGDALKDAPQRKFYSESAANALLHDYPVDSSITVFYDPQRPGDSLLVPGVRPTAWAIATLVVVLLAALAWLTFAAGGR